MGSHTDINYTDYYYDSPHANVAHQDVASYDDHSDVTHSDSPHYDGYSDSAHNDLSHLDGTYSDYYSANVSDITKWILKNSLGVSDGSIDGNSFNDLAEARTQTIGLFISDVTEAVEVIRKLQVTGVFRLIVSPEGVFSVKFFTVSGDVVTLSPADISSIVITYDPSSIYATVIVGFRRDCSLDTYEYKYATEPKVLYRFGVTQTLIIESLLYHDEEAQTLADFYLSQAKGVRKYVGAKFVNPAGEFNIADRISIPKSVVDEFGNVIEVVGSSEVFGVNTIQDNFVGGGRTVELQDESSLSGSFHADSEHQDSYTDSYTDIPYEDAAHGDSHTDTPHLDSEHSDVAHEDAVHTDTYYDHTDYSDHSDRVYIDEESHGDSHFDTAHADVAHSDVAHSDFHNDSHSDSEHTDSPYSDSYVDIHADLQHADSYY